MWIHCILPQFFIGHLFQKFPRPKGSHIGHLFELSCNLLPVGHVLHFAGDKMLLE